MYVLHRFIQRQWTRFGEFCKVYGKSLRMQRWPMREDGYSEMERARQKLEKDLYKSKG